LQHKALSSHEKEPVFRLLFLRQRLVIVLLAAGGIAACTVLGAVLRALVLRILTVAVVCLVLLLVIVLRILVIIILRHLAYLLIVFGYMDSMAVCRWKYTWKLKILHGSEH
jgi:hypothetical protein